MAAAACRTCPKTRPRCPPTQEMKTFYMPPGYHVELVASEPLIQDPILMDWDFQGRLWVIEMPAFIPDLGPKHDRDPICDIVVLEDTNNDGKMDKRTVFADHLVLPRTMKILDHGVLVAEPPNLWLMRDTNGDLKADTKELVTDTFGDRAASVEHNANSLFWAMDNWMYTSEHTKYYRMKNGKFEVASTLPRGQWGVTQDDDGHIFRNTNSQALNVDLDFDALLPAQSEHGADARHVRIARRRDAGPERDVAGATESRRESRVSERAASPGWDARDIHRGQLADRVPRRSASRRVVRQRVSRRAVGQPGEPRHPERRRNDDARQTRI